MKRAALVLALVLGLPAAAFSLIDLSLSPSTPLVWFEAHAPAGSIAVLSGYDSITANTVNIAAGQRMYQRIKPLRLSFTTTAAGSTGTYTYEAFDTTSAASICISGSLACNTSVGTASVDCLAGGTATANPGDDVVVRVNATSCTTTAPTGTVALEYSQVLQDEGVDFVPRFLPMGLYGLDAGGAFFGLDAYQFDSITCGWSQAGIISGGTDIMRVQFIQKSDAGVVCTCDLPGTCADAPNSEHTCTCGAVKYLTDFNGLKSGYAMQLNSATNCGFNPQNLICAIPLHR